jgi:hypothetical protein
LYVEVGVLVCWCSRPSLGEDLTLGININLFNPFSLNYS